MGSFSPPWLLPHLTKTQLTARRNQLLTSNPSHLGYLWTCPKAAGWKPSTSMEDGKLFEEDICLNVSNLKQKKTWDLFLGTQLMQNIWNVSNPHLRDDSKKTSAPNILAFRAFKDHTLAAPSLVNKRFLSWMLLQNSQELGKKWNEEGAHCSASPSCSWV